MLKRFFALEIAASTRAGPLLMLQQPPSAPSGATAM
jgi:hypothetical protein